MDLLYSKDLNLHDIKEISDMLLNFISKQIHADFYSLVLYDISRNLLCFINTAGEENFRKDCLNIIQSSLNHEFAVKDVSIKDIFCKSGQCTCIPLVIHYPSIKGYVYLLTSNPIREDTEKIYNISSISSVLMSLALLKRAIFNLNRSFETFTSLVKSILSCKSIHSKLSMLHHYIMNILNISDTAIVRMRSKEDFLIYGKGALYEILCNSSDKVIFLNEIIANSSEIMSYKFDIEDTTYYIITSGLYNQACEVYLDFITVKDFIYIILSLIEVSEYYTALIPSDLHPIKLIISKLILRAFDTITTIKEYATIGYKLSSEENVKQIFASIKKETKIAYTELERVESYINHYILPPSKDS